MNEIICYSVITNFIVENYVSGSARKYGRHYQRNEGIALAKKILLSGRFVVFLGAPFCSRNMFFFSKLFFLYSPHAFIEKMSKRDK